MLSVMMHSVFVFVFFQIAALIKIEHFIFADLLFIIPIGLITTTIPMAPAGIGIGHIAFDTLYRMIGHLRSGRYIQYVRHNPAVCFSVRRPPLFFLQARIQSFAGTPNRNVP